MSEEKTKIKLLDAISPLQNRWFIVIGAILIQLALGTIYCWGTLTVFITPFLQEEKTATVFIFGVGLLAFAITMIFAGQLQQKIGPMKTAFIGGALMGGGVIISAFMTSLWGLIFTYGIIFGSGIGFAYVCPIAAAAKWFPDKKGLINGLAVAGFGAGAFIFNFVIKGLASVSIPTMFIVLGIIYMIMIGLGALTLHNPPEGWTPEGWTAPPAQVGVTSHRDVPRNETIKTKSFWILWGMFVLSAISGLMVLGSYANFARSVDASENFIYVIGSVNFVLLGSIMALFNGLGRVFWGKLADMLNYKKAMLIMFGFQGILMILYFFTNGSSFMYWIVSPAIIFCFGGNFSLFPTATADLFGTKNLGPNYGVVFTAYGIAGFLGATMVQIIVSALGSYLVLFIIMGVMSLIAAGLTFIVKPPESEK
ncbi:MAG: L-lactate MFS transporter [Promethearchaeota archaeon]